ncbi:MAG: CoA transferase [Syntrophobacterales bacterium]|nr:CoA transferase [Syntrophobacterales bacterium]
MKKLKILDFTTLLPGLFATMTLADLGADVLRGSLKGPA